MHIIPSWALCPTCLPFLPPLHTSPQLTETWQWPTCMCWQPKLTLLFFWSRLLGLGKVLPPTSCHLWNPFGIQRWPVPLEQGLPLLGKHEPARLRCGHPDCQCNAPPGPSASSFNFPSHFRCSDGLPGLGRWRFSEAIAKVIGHQLPNWIPFPLLSNDTCRLATVAFCDAALFWRSRYTCL